MDGDENRGLDHDYVGSLGDWHRIGPMDRNANTGQHQDYGHHDYAVERNRADTSLSLKRRLRVFPFLRAASAPTLPAPAARFK